ncbi:phosphonate transport system ATP-binding protein [Antricoccus suffuscus]|uniref:Phosphonate transport system ATP-binding protein n=1 Tax=Antricoccus suffuscus TaxID=1629062 RepID=A0A2T0ZW09_9ACTN|nr:phosphonate ABC transporter ATP-binding protein [Antricoccus suffuscus]PRZ40541.1 phosphonate transport system ATP-binding protein [Antricoccus suffuscus]
MTPSTTDAALGVGTPPKADIRFEHVDVVYPNGFKGLDDINLSIPAGEMVGVVGLSGAGKSTLVRSINGLVRITGGEITVGERQLSTIKGAGMRELRSNVGMVFQGFNLAKRTTVLNNVLVGRLFHTSTWRTLIGAWKKDDVELAMDALARVEILPKAYTRASELSGGQQQRVGIARTLAQRPSVILADEPVASLDPPTSHVVMRDLQRINQELGVTVITNLHFLDLARRYCDRLVGLRSGKLVFDGIGADADENVFESIYGRSLTAEDVMDAKPVLDES